VCERELITAHMKQLLDMDHSGLVSMLKDDKVEDLRRMYELFGLKGVSGGHQAMRDLMSAYVEQTGKDIITDDEAAKNYLPLVKALLDLKDKFDALLSNAFRGDTQFTQALHGAFQRFVNLNDKSPEFLSLFINEKLIKGLKGATEEEVDAILDKVMTLFRFLREKDVFEKYYKQHLAKRLLLGRSVSDDAERNMITKLKQECGYQFTSKLEGMFTDMKVGSDTMDDFKEYIRQQSENPLKGVDLNVNVLTTGYWPTQSSVSCNMPPEILNCCEVFKDFYLANHNGRRLQWQTNMGSAEVRAQFATKKHELSVSTYQLVILMNFNGANQMDFGALQEATAIPIPDLKRNLLALSRGKYKVLVKNPPTNVCGDTDKFLFNSKFRSKLFKIRILQAVAAESKGERKETRQKVDEDRKHQIEAAIVRIMKARKELDHNNLVSETTKQLQARFMPSPLLVKKRIESLIEREYLERAPNSHKVYRYLA
jgi:cullin 3